LTFDIDVTGVSVTRVIVLYLYTEFKVRTPSRSEDIPDFRSRR